MKCSPSCVLALSVSLSFIGPASAGFKILCDSLLRQRQDPIISPQLSSGGLQVSQHAHLFAGANGMDFTNASVTTANLLKSNCTSCLVKEDKSVYWAPQLYYQSANGSYTAVRLDGDNDGVRGGINIYYSNRAPGGYQYYSYAAFKPGFRMIAGNPFRRTNTTDFAGQAVTFQCIGYNGTNTFPNSANLPNVPCSGGIRAQLNFPQCWDGVNLDSPTHNTHVAYPLPNNASAGLYNQGPDGGQCPSTHPKYLMQLFYEIVFRTDNPMYPFYSNATNNYTQPFVFANGDPTGYGFHGDFLNGWDENILSYAANNCNMGPSGSTGDAAACANFTIAAGTEAQMCELAPAINEDVIGPLAQLPGCNPIQSGPASATVVPSCTRTGVVGPKKTYYSDQTKTFGYGYIGCGNDTQNAAGTFSSGTYLYPGYGPLTVESCVSYCNQGGWKYAAMEYAHQCFCGNSKIVPNRMPQPGILGNCDTPCSANASEICGGTNAVSIYQRCAKNGTTCINSPSA